MIALMAAIDLMIIPSEATELAVHDLMSELLKLEECDVRVGNSSVSATVSTGDVSIEVGVREETYDQAVELASATLRTAIHAVGGNTADWNVQVPQEDPRFERV